MVAFRCRVLPDGTVLELTVSSTINFTLRGIFTGKGSGGSVVLLTVIL